jgi:ATP-dependent RNA helicase DeaD
MITALSEALAERGFDTLTPVQEAVTAPELADADLLVSAQTGSGKTVGFGMAIAHTLMGDDAQFGPAAAPLALVVAPTRELALQVMRELGWLYARTGAVVTSCVGGMDSRQERRVLERGVHIVVGTPGRLCDHINRGALDLSGLRAVVLDEADEMLDLGFREDLEFILSEAPAERRTLLFSATVSPMIAKLAQSYQRDAQRVNTLSKTQQHTDISYQALRVAESDSENAIFNLLRYHDAQSAIVFANTRASVAHLSARLTNRGIQTVTLSGELSQTERSHALQAMRDGRARVCVATDVAARGIDLPSLELVIHADLPSNGETLLHRSGRTGRAGRKGISALIVPPKIVGKAERLLKWAKLTAEWTTAPSADDVWRKDEERLLSDPDWNTPLSAEQEVFAAKLLAQYAPEQIAAGYLRLYQARNAPPEDLLPPDAKPAKSKQQDFGPSKWLALSIGQNEQAEARWLLPLLCRAGGLERGAIGAIRVQSSETFVEIREDDVAPFFARLGAGAVLEKDITVRALDTAPEFALGAGGRGDGRRNEVARPDRPRADGPRPKPAYAPSGPKPKPARPPRAEGGSDDKPWQKPDTRPKPAYKADERREKPSYDPDAPRAPARAKPAYNPDAPRASARPKPAYKSDERREKPAYNPDAPRAPARAKPAYKADERREKPSYNPDAPRPPKPAYKAGASDKPRFKSDAPRKEWGEDRGERPAGKPFKGKPAPRPGAKPDRAKPAPAPRSDARDTSARFTPPGAAAPARKPRTKAAPGAKPAGKPGFKPAGKGGSAPPRRPKP